MHKLLLPSVILLVGLAGVLAYVFFTPSKQSTGNQLVFQTTEYDFGVVKQSTGKVSHDFKFTYQGDRPIDIKSLPTSCGCTTAVANKTHLVSGDTGIITITFNPNHHQEPAGKFFRTVDVVTSPRVSAPELKIWQSVDMDVGPQIFEMNQLDND